jgi:ribosomal protein S27AE
MICPNCGHDVTPQGVSIAPPLAVCPECGRTVVVLDDGLRLATADDTRALSNDARVSLRKLRP